MANGSNGNGGSAASTAVGGLLQNPKFLAGAFIAAIVLLILAHKITIEGMIEA